MSIFLSHSYEDFVPFVRSLAEGLRKHNLKIVTLNRETSSDIPNPFEKVTEALKECKLAVIVASPRYFESRWCKAEIGAIWNLHIRGVLKLFVIRYDMSEAELDISAPLFARQHVIDANNPESLIIDLLLEAGSQKIERNKPHGPVPIILSGCGNWAQNRTVIPLLQRSPDLFKVIAVSDLEDDEHEFDEIVLPKFENIASNFNEIKFYNHLPAALEAFKDQVKEQPISVAINTPNRFHDSLSTVALHNGFDVYAERPINRKGEKLPLLLRRAREKNLYLYTGTQRRAEDSFSYLRHVVGSGDRFGKLRSIFCLLRSGRRPEGWRTVFSLAGGGVIMDEGYHLLDASLWIAMASQPSLAALTENDLKGYVVTKDFITDKIESSASGKVNLGDVDLEFSFTYRVPKNSILEFIEILDHQGTCVRLMRNQTSRDSTPGWILHQSAEGEIFREGYVFRHNGQFHFDKSSSRSFADNTAPLRQFLSKVGSGFYDPDEQLIVGENECDARFVAATQELIKGIYKLSLK